MKHGERGSNVLIALAALVFLFLPESRARAQDPRGNDAGVKVSAPQALLENEASDGWVPIVVPVENGTIRAATVRVRAECYANSQLRYSAEKTVVVAEKTKRRETIWVHADGESDRIRVQVDGSSVRGTSSDLTVTHRSRRSGNEGLVRALLVREGAQDASAIDWLACDSQRLTVELRKRALTGREMPEHPSGLDGIDLVVLSKTGERDWAEPARRALVEWQERGGTVLLLPGADPAWFRDDLVRRFLPKGAEVVSLEKQSYPLIPNPTGRDGLLELRAYAAQTDEPAVSLFDPFYKVWRRGAGQTIFLGVDLEAAPFDRSLAAKRRLAELLLAGPQAPRGAPSWDPDSSLENGLDVGESPSQIWMIPVVVAYILCVGPFNFALLKRRQAQVLILATTPLVAVVFTGFVFLNGYLARGFRTVVQRATILEARSGEDAGALRTGLTIYSSSSSSYKVSGHPSLIVRHKREANAAPEKVVQDEGKFTFPVVPLDLWEKAFFEGRGLHALGGTITVTPVASGGTNPPSYEISNRSALDLGKGVLLLPRSGALESARGGARICRVPPLAPGKKAQVAAGAPVAAAAPPASPADELTEALLLEKTEKAFVHRALAGLGVATGRLGDDRDSPLYVALVSTPLPAIEAEGWEPTNELSLIAVRCEKATR